MCALPASALAAVRITGVMYNPAGIDQGREWILLTNTGTTSVNLAGYRLYEAGVNHKLVVASGTSTLEANAVAIITTDPTQYASDHPSFSGSIFKSSFSLSNTSETIELKDSKLAVVDTYSYVAPPVVKAPVPAKVAKMPKSPTVSKPSSYSYAAGNQTAALPLALPTLPVLPSIWLYGLGVATLAMLGFALFLYVRPVTPSATSSSIEEFELE